MDLIKVQYTVTTVRSFFGFLAICSSRGAGFGPTQTSNFLHMDSICLTGASLPATLEAPGYFRHSRTFHLRRAVNAERVSLAVIQSTLLLFVTSLYTVILVRHICLT